MSLPQVVLEYVLVYCTATGLSYIGEPSLSTPPSDSSYEASHVGDPMPAWMILIFVFLAAANWILSFLVRYVYLVVSTVVIVSNQPIRVIAAANASTHESSHRARLDRLIRTIRVVGAFKTAKTDRLSREKRTLSLGNVTVDDVKADLQRRNSLQPRKPRHRLPGPILRTWYRITGLPCFRGFTSLLIITIAQWLLAFVADFLLSGQPTDHKLGYGTTSLVLQTVFASSYAVWTHFTITKPSNKNVFEHFPQGPQILAELWPITALWAVADHFCLSAPLALSRSFKLKQYAFNAQSWNSLSREELHLVLFQFLLVHVLYLSLVVLVSIPATMITRRVHASMLSEDDIAIVPYHSTPSNNPTTSITTTRGSSNSSLARRTHLRKPSFTLSQAWSTITLTAYTEVVKIYFQAFCANQVINFAYWALNWKLYHALGVEGYAPTNLPWSPVGVVLALSEGALPGMGDEGREL